MFIQAVLYDRTFSVFRSKTCVGIIETQWWQTWTLAGINEKGKVWTKYMLTMSTNYSLEITPMIGPDTIKAYLCIFRRELKKTTPLLCMKKPPQSDRDILTLTETESRLSLGMTSNKTYHFRTTANHHRFMKVWTSIADIPTSKFCPNFFFGKSMAQKYPTYL